MKQPSMSLKYQPSSEPLPNYVRQLFLHREHQRVPPHGVGLAWSSGVVTGRRKGDSGLHAEGNSKLTWRAPCPRGCQSRRARSCCCTWYGVRFQVSGFRVQGAGLRVESSSHRARSCCRTWSVKVEQGTTTRTSPAVGSFLWGGIFL